MNSIVNKNYKDYLISLSMNQRRGKISMFISTALAECVRAPIEIRSTPVSATFLIFSKLILPEASIII